MQPGDLRYVVFSLELADGVDGHGDILLRLGWYRQVCDSYYYFLDDSFMAGDELPLALARFLVEWGRRVETLRGRGGTVLLPFGLFDQCTAWLRVVSTNGRTVAATAGWSPVPGYSLMPSEFDSVASSVADFDPIPRATVHTGIDDLVVAIAKTRSELAAMSSK